MKKAITLLALLATLGITARAERTELPAEMQENIDNLRKEAGILRKNMDTLIEGERTAPHGSEERANFRAQKYQLDRDAEEVEDLIDDVEDDVRTCC